MLCVFCERYSWIISFVYCCPRGRGGGGGCSLIWPIRGCDAEQSMVFYLSVQNGVYTEFRVSLS